MTASGNIETGLCYSTPCHKALVLTYALITQHMKEEDKQEFDGWHHATAQEVKVFQEDQKAERMRLIAEMGEISDGS